MGYCCIEVFKRFSINTNRVRLKSTHLKFFISPYTGSPNVIYLFIVYFSVPDTLKLLSIAYY